MTSDINSKILAKIEIKILVFPNNKNFQKKKWYEFRDLWMDFLFSFSKDN